MPPFKAPKDITISWNTWRKGLNTLLRENEVDGAEMVTATNLLLVGSGVPTKRWGSQDFFEAGATGTGRMLMTTKDNLDNIQVLAITDWGMLTKKNGASYTKITGASWASGYNVEAAQLGNKLYLVSEQRPLVRYDFSSLVGFTTLATPMSLSATAISIATGSINLNSYSWRVTAVSKAGGETLASTPVSLASMPQDLSKAFTRIFWTPVSAASGDLVAYNIYRGPSTDDLTWVGGVDNLTNYFDDPGTPSTDPTRIAPVSDSTGGIRAKYVIRFQDRLVYAGIPGEPTKLVISGRYPNHERLDFYGGGTLVYIEPDSGEGITGLATYQNNSTSSQTIIVFKENSVWEVSLSINTSGTFGVTVAAYRLLTASQGCSSHRSIRAVENDIMFSNRKGIYILRYEPQLLNVINANEISAKIRTFFESLSDEDLRRAAALYADKKYLLAFPISAQFIVFDRERLCFYGPWPMPFGIAQMQKYVDVQGQEHWIGIDSTDTMVTEFSKSLPDDKGTAIKTLFKSRKEDFGDWTIFKTINEVYLLFRSVYGQVNVNLYIEERSGTTVVARSFSIEGSGASGASGFGTDMFGNVMFGLTQQTPQTSTNEIPQKAFIYKTSRTFQLEVRTSGRTDQFELLGAKVIAIPQARGNSPSSWNV